MSEDPSWRRNCQLLTQSLQSLQKKISIIRRSTKKLVVPADITKEGEKIRELTRAAAAHDVSALQEALQMMERFLKIHPCYSADGVKLMGEAQHTLRDYQNACDGFYNTCIRVEEKNKGASLANHLEDDVDDEDDAEESERLLATTKMTQRAKYEQELQNEIVLEIERETHEIAENVRDVNIIFSHITKLVEEQGVQLNQIDRNLEVAERSTRAGTEQLQRASNHQRQSTRFKWIIIVIVSLIVIISLHLLAK